MGLTPERVLAVLVDIDDGTVPLVAGGPWGWNGNRGFTSAGWVFVVFNDAGDWDYIDSVRSPEGDLVLLWAEDGPGSGPEWEPVREWTPDNEERWTDALSLERVTDAL